MRSSYRSLFCIVTFIVPNNTFYADIPNPTPFQKLAWPTMQSSISPRFLNGLACIGACTCLVAFIGIGRYLYNRYVSPRPQPTLAEWIAKMEQQSHSSQKIDPAIQRSAYHFIQNKTVLPHTIADSNPFHLIAPLLQYKTYFSGETDRGEPGTITIEPPQPIEGSKRFCFIVHHGLFISVMIEKYEYGGYHTSLYHPRNQSDAAEGDLWLQRANALVHAQQRYHVVKNQF